MKSEVGNKHTIDTDGKTVWVNGELNCLGRFSQQAYEIYPQLAEFHPYHAVHGKGVEFSYHIKTLNESSLKLTDWNDFVKAIKTYHNIDVADKFMPERFKNELL